MGVCWITTPPRGRRSWRSRPRTMIARVPYSKTCTTCAASGSALVSEALAWHRLYAMVVCGLDISRATDISPPRGEPVSISQPRKITLSTYVLKGATSNASPKSSWRIRNLPRKARFSSANWV
ncbi:TPA_asm: UL4.5 [Human alphaherpesvirus 1]|nr:TPA_asm: UL4.5 [Human alphaherpesvirus 1]